jgi:vacuolar-type H+-ATPase subunit E/Vma4
MESMEQGKQALISSIEADAQVELEKIVQDAHDQAEEKKAYARKKVESILQEARDKAAVQADAIQRKIISSADLEIKRRHLQVQNVIVQDIQDRVIQEMAAKVKTPTQYGKALEAWIVEAAVGLGAQAAEVNASAPERKLLTKTLLERAATQVRKQTGEAVTLTLSKAGSLSLQGVILTAEDGRTAFNNQVKTRLARNQRQIKRLIHDALFAAQAKE